MFKEFQTVKSTCLFIIFFIFNTLNANTVLANEDEVPMDEIKRFTTILNMVKHYYVKDVDDKTLFESAIRGTLSELDPHSAYFNTKEFDELEEDTYGQFGGVGISFVLDKGYAKVVTPIEDSPAAKAGVKSEDSIIKIDDTLVKGLTHEEIRKIIRGEPGSIVTFTVIRKNHESPIVIEVVRDIIHSPSVKAVFLGDILYLRVPVFQADTGKELIQELQKIKRSKKTFNGLILDLRNNPGGVVDAAVTMCDAFLDKNKIGHDKKIVFTKGKVKELQLVKKATTTDILSGTPIIAIINGGSASASEIVAAALQDHKRAIILGERSFGKGSVQSVVPLQNEHGIKLTTSLYYTPSGRSIQAKGITPDVVIENLAMPEQDSKDKLTIRESNLPGHLPNGNDNTSKKYTRNKNNSYSKQKIETEDTLDSRELEIIKHLKENDYQVNQAINILIALNLEK